MIYSTRRVVSWCEDKKQDITKINSIMSISNELQYPSSNLSEIFTQRNFQPRFKKIKKYFSSYRADKLDIRKDKQRERKTDRHRDEYTDRQTQAMTMTSRPQGCGGKDPH